MISLGSVLMLSHLENNRNYQCQQKDQDHIDGLHLHLHRDHNCNCNPSLQLKGILKHLIPDITESAVLTIQMQFSHCHLHFQNSHQYLYLQGSKRHNFEYLVEQKLG